jgi:hypothetical protein
MGRCDAGRRNDRSLRVVQHDARFAVEPTRVFINERNDAAEIERQDAVGQHAPPGARLICRSCALSITV